MNEKRSTLRWLAALPLGAVALASGRASAVAPSAHAADPVLAELLARQQITDVLNLYARGNDRCDEPLIRSCFWPGATYKFGAFDGTAADFVTFGMTIVRPLKWCLHHISNVLIEVHGDRAVSECQFFAHHRRLAQSGTGEEDAYFEGRYLDRMERRGGVWKSAHRIGIIDFLADAPAAQPYEAIVGHGGKAPDDPLYAMLSDLRAQH